MAENENVLQRSMFNAAPSTSAVNPTIGIPSVRSPAQTANELRNMFAPQPVQSFRGGGEVINGVKHFQEGGLNLVDQSGVFPGTEMIPREPTEGLTGLQGLLQRGAMGLRSLRPLPDTPISFPQEGEMPPRIPGRVYDLPEATDIPRAPQVNPALAEQQGMPASAAPPAQRPKGALELTLDGIKADRQRNAEEKKQNALLALMQAGFAIAAGRSPSAIANIGAGAQAGIASFANMEKDRRAEESSLRREQTAIMLERERMRAQEERQPEAIRTYAVLGGWDPSTGREGFNEAVRRGIEVTKSLEKEPDNIRLFRALGNGDVARGFEVFKGDESLKAAQATVALGSMASEEDKRRAQSYLNMRIQQSLQALQGQPGQRGQTPPAGSTVIPFNQLPVR